MTKKVIKNSSKESMKASAAAPASTGAICGSVTRLNTVQGPAPRSRATSSIERSSRSSAIRMRMNTNGNANTTCPISTVSSERSNWIRARKVSSAAPMNRPGSRTGAMNRNCSGPRTREPVREMA